MHLFILSNSVNFEVSEITLEDGCLPSIAGHQHGSTPEPAIWFKVLVIDAVSIDCTERRILWNSVPNILLDLNYVDSGIVFGSSYLSSADGSVTELTDSARFRRQISDSLFDCGDCCSYDRDLDEVFDAVPRLLLDYREDCISKEAFHDGLMRLLHVSVLPNIKLGCEDIGNVERSLKQQDSFLKKVDDEILLAMEKLEKRRRDKKLQRKKFIKQLMLSSTSSTRHLIYSEDLVKALLKDISLDIRVSWEALERTQNDVDKCKESIDTGRRGMDEAELHTKRNTRDEANVSYEELLSVREKLRETSEPAKSKKTKTLFTFRKQTDCEENDVLCKIYLELTRGENETVSEIEKLADKKVLILSVREAIRSTRDKLLMGEETFGLDMDSTGSLNATNVLNSVATTSSWQTLAEQVAGVIGNSSHELFKVHWKFCGKINSECERAMDEAKTNRMSPSARSTLCIRNSGLPDFSVDLSSTTSTVRASPDASSSGSDGSVDRQSLSPTDHARATNSRQTGSCVDSVSGDVNVLNKRECSVGLYDFEEARNADCSNAVVVDPSSRRSADSTYSGKSRTSSGNATAAQNERRRNKLSRSSKTKRPSVPSFHSYVRDGSSSTPNDVDSYYFVGTETAEGDERNYLRRVIDDAKESIRCHFDVVCCRLQTQLNRTQQRDYRKIWLSYESHFYQETMDRLVEIYQLEYRKTETLWSVVGTLTISDLSLDDAILSHMVQDVNASSSSPPSFPQNAAPSNSTATAAAEKQNRPIISMEKNLSKLLRPKHRRRGDSSSSTIVERESENRILSTANVTEPADVNDREISKDIRGRDRPSAVDGVGQSGVDADDQLPDPCVLMLRRRLSESCKKRPVTIRMSLNVPYTKSSVIIYERTVCPFRNSMHVSDADPGTGAGGGHWSTTSTSGSYVEPLLEEERELCQSKTVQLKPKYRKKFAPAFQCIDAIMTTRYPSTKFFYLTKCLREVSREITNFYAELYGKTVGACSDELMDALVILLCNIDGRRLMQLYSQIMLLADIIPPFYSGSPSSFTLVQFVGACQFIQERVMLRRNRASVELQS